MSVDFRQRTPGELARMIWRRKWLIALPTVVVAVAVAWVVSQMTDSDLTIRINNITQEVTSRSTLEPMIERYNLYAVERRRGASMDELVERMRTKDIKINL